ncbi:MAG TPA: hypothetical protein VFP31_05635 [Gaiellaceae bacterium]|nr:hypothetical protein [Gaiellaceae bacterium]
MTGLLLANALYFAIGVGLLPLLRIAPDRAALGQRLPLAYAVGVAATGIVAAHLALIDVPLGLVELVVLAAVVLFLGLRRVRDASGSEPQTRPGEPLWSRLVGAGALVLALVLLAHAWSTYEIRPLLEWDGWAIWGTKARALYEFGGATGPVFTSDAYLPLQHPLLLPALEATDFRAMGVYDPTVVHVQLLLLAVGFLLAFVALLRDRVPFLLVGTTVLAVLAAEPVLKQLSTNLADVPLALFVALGLVGLGRWLATAERWPLVAGTLFLGAAALTKSEGLFFALAALLAVAPFTWRRWRELGAATLALVAIVLPWRLFVELHGLPLVEYRFRNAFSPSYLSDHSDRVRPAADGLLDQIFTSDWGLLVPLFAAALVTAILARRYALAGFAALWAVLSFLGLVLIYWISVIPIDLALVWSGDRTVVTLVVGAGALSALLAGIGLSRAEARGTR